MAIWQKGESMQMAAKDLDRMSLRELQELLKAARSDEPVKLIWTFNIRFH